MGIVTDCKQVVDDKPPSPLSALQREVLYARIRAFSVRIQYAVWNLAATVMLYLFNDAMLNGYIWDKCYLKLIAFHCFQIVSIVFYFVTSLHDPGYIPLNENENALFEGDSSSSDDDGIPQWNKNILIDAKNAPTNFCWRCKFVRPLRSKHCYDCDRCIGRFDHHCPMVGNCIGGGNHRYFMVFLLSQSVVLLWALQLSANDMWLHFEQYHTFGNLDLSVPLVLKFVFFIILSAGMLVVLGLCGFHCYLSSTNQTTFEMVRPQALEKWDKEERKRELRWKRKNKWKRDMEYREVNAQDDEDISDPEEPPEKSFHRVEETEHISFSQGLCRNVYSFWTGEMKPEWTTPLSCILKDSDSGDE